MIVGAIAKYIVPGEGPGGLIGDIIVGILGALLGGWLFNSVLHWGAGSWIAGFIEAIIGAVILLYILRVLTARRV